MLSGLYINAVLTLARRVSDLTSEGVLAGSSEKFVQKYNFYSWVARMLGVKIAVGEGERKLVVPLEMES